MDFDFTSEQVMLRDSISKFTAAKYEFDKRRTMMASPQGWKAAWEGFAELGLLAAPLPVEFGGLGGGPIDLLVVMEEFGKALVVEPYVQTVVVGGGVLDRAGTVAQKQAHLAAIATGDRIIAFAQSEPTARFNLADVATSASKQGGGFVLNGQKSVVIGAPQADYQLVTARTAGARREANGVSLFLVPKAVKGVTTRDYGTVDGFKAADVYFENVAVGAEHLIGGVDAGLALVEEASDHAIAALCAEACGAMRQANVLTLDYARTRKQFGMAISAFQVLQHRMADMFMAVEQAISMTYMVALKLETPQRAIAASAAKARIGQAGRFVGQNAIQIHGGMGMTDEMKIGHYFKRLTMIDAQFGNADHHVRRYASATAANAR